MRQKPKTPMQITRAPNPAKKAIKASCVLWNARIIARFAMPNAPAQARQGSGVRLSTETRTRRCLQPDGWAILSSPGCQRHNGKDYRRSTEEPIDKNHRDERARMVSVSDLASKPRIKNAERDPRNRGHESQHQDHRAKNQSDKCHC